MTGSPLVSSNHTFSTPLTDLTFPKPNPSPVSFHQENTSGIHLSFPKIEDPFGASPLTRNNDFFGNKRNRSLRSPLKRYEQSDVLMSEDNSLDRRPKSEPTQKTRKSPKLSFPLQSLSAEINSLTSIDTYFSCPQGSTKQPENVIPTKRRNTSSYIPPNTSALIDSKPSLSWKPIDNALTASRAPSKVPLKPLEYSPMRLPVFNFNASTPCSRKPVFKNHQPGDFNHPTPQSVTPVPGSKNPRNNVKRIHSLFSHPKDFMIDPMNQTVPEKVIVAPSPATPRLETTSILEKVDCPIKTHSVNEDQFKRIDRDTLCEILDGSFSHLYDRFMVIDCRFEYEYDGGHIDGAININTKEKLEEVLLPERLKDEKVLLVFHCEYSAHRGPRMAKHLRNLDRQRNINRYPFLSYPDIAILSGGYSHFFTEYGERCYPQKYVEMNDTLHQHTCERELGRFKRDMRFTRTQSMNTNSFMFPVSQNKSGQGLDGSPLVNASKSFSCLEFTTLTKPVDGPTTPTCRPFRKLGVKRFLR